MAGEINLSTLLASMKPELHRGEYVFCTVPSLNGLPIHQLVAFFTEKEGITVILPISVANRLQLQYTFVAAWITLTIHSSLEAVGLTAAFSKVLSDANISCNVVAAYYHDHIFVPVKDAARAMDLLYSLAAAQ